MNPPEGGRVQGLNEKCEYLDMEKAVCNFIDVMGMRPSLNGDCNCPSCRPAILEMRKRRLI
ncbi:MAG: hypothetical protein GXO65_02855 [Euryarchaeota archaeon]|nr:hypothetical protein [Euryarchaeota archaeon]